MVRCETIDSIWYVVSYHSIWNDNVFVRLHNCLAPYYVFEITNNKNSPIVYSHSCFLKPVCGTHKYILRCLAWFRVHTIEFTNVLKNIFLGCAEERKSHLLMT